MKNSKFIWSAIIILGIVFSCNKDELEVGGDPRTISTDGFFSNSENLTSAVNSGYAFLQTQGMYGRSGFYMFDNLSQENQGSDVLQAPLRSFMEYTFDPTNGELFLYWEAAYRGVNSANFVINAEEEGIIENVSQEEINQRVGEAKFLRALYYFYLTNLWGDIPLLTVVPDNIDGFPRAPQSEVYALILEDLDFAKNNLPAKSATETGRATRGAAIALKGKVHLFLKEYDKAKTELESLSGYTLDGVAHIDNGNVAGEFNDESIFEINFSREIGGAPWDVSGAGLSETTFRALEYSSAGGFANITVRNGTFNEFESDDPRIQSTFYQAGDEYGPNRYAPGDKIGDRELTAADLGPLDSDGTGRLIRKNPAPEWRKYQNLEELENEDFAYSGVNFRVIRYADVLLMRAEAENELGNSGAAIALLNMVRDRSGMPNYGTAEMNSRGYPVNSKQEIFDAIVHERIVELAGEQVRYLDLQRWGLASQVLDGYQKGKHEFLPIPQNEIDRNPQLSSEDQNPNY